MADFETLKRWVMSDWKIQFEFRENAEKEIVFEAGWQWTEDETNHLKTNQRLPIVFNRVQPIIQSVVGLEISNRTEVSFVPREIGDVETNEILTASAQWFRDQAGAEETESEAFRDLLICGTGWTETSLDFEEDEEGHPKIDRIDPLEMGWDARARKKGLTDATRIFRVHRMSLEQAQEQWPDFDAQDLNADWIGTSGSDTISKTIDRAGDEYAVRDAGEQAGEDTEGEELVTIVQIQWRERQEYVEFVNPATGLPEQVTAEQFDPLYKKLQETGVQIPHRSFTKKTWHQAYLGKDIIETNQPSPERPTFCAMTGMWDHQEKRFYGLLRIMQDPQKYANKWLSLVIHIINSNAKGGLMAEESAVSDPVLFAENWAAADSIAWLKSGGIARVTPKPLTQIPPALMQLTEFAISSIRDVAGVNLEIMGMREAQQAGVLEYQRRQAAMTTLARYFDAMRHYRKTQGRIILHFLREYIAPSGRIVRIMQEGREQYVPLAMEKDTAKYDVIIDEAPANPNQKEKTWQVLQQMLPLLVEAGLSTHDWADVLEYSPLPSTFIKKIREKAQQNNNQEPSPQEQAQMAMLQSQLQKTQAEIAKLQSETSENQSDIKAKQAKAILDIVKAQQITQDTNLKPAQVAQTFMQPTPSNKG